MSCFEVLCDHFAFRAKEKKTERGLDSPHSSRSNGNEDKSKLAGKKKILFIIKPSSNVDPYPEQKRDENEPANKDSRPSKLTLFQTNSLYANEQAISISRQIKSKQEESKIQSQLLGIYSQPGIQDKRAEQQLSIDIKLDQMNIPEASPVKIRSASRHATFPVQEQNQNKAENQENMSILQKATFGHYKPNFQSLHSNRKDSLESPSEIMLQPIRQGHLNIDGLNSASPSEFESFNGSFHSKKQEIKKKEESLSPKVAPFFSDRRVKKFQFMETKMIKLNKIECHEINIMAPEEEDEKNLNKFISSPNITYHLNA